MKTLEVDLNKITDDELESYIILKKAMDRVRASERRPTQQPTMSKQQLEQNVKEANQGWMSDIPKFKTDELPEPPNYR